MTSTLPDILFCGDPHGKFDHITRAAISRRPEAVVLLGDLDAPDYLSKVLAPVLSICTVLWIIGNHDTDSEELYLRLVEDPGHANLHCIDDKIVEVGDCVSLAWAGCSGKRYGTQPLARRTARGSRQNATWRLWAKAIDGARDCR